MAFWCKTPGVIAGGGVTLGGKKYKGCAIWPYADYDEHYWDGWVARMALPVESLLALQGGDIDDRPSGAERIEKGPPRREIENHYIHIDDGQFDPKGDYPSSEARTQELINKAVTDMSGTRDNAPGHILLYAHGGLNVFDKFILSGKQVCWRVSKMSYWVKTNLPRKGLEALVTGQIRYWRKSRNLSGIQFGKK